MQQLIFIPPPVVDRHDAHAWRLQSAGDVLVRPLGVATRDPDACLTLSHGGLLAESWWAPGCVTFMLSGTLRTHDRYLLVDAITGALLVGARHVHIECSGLESADVAALLGLAQVRRFIDGIGGTFGLTGLQAGLEGAWRTLDGSSPPTYGRDEMRT